MVECLRVSFGLVGSDLNLEGTGGDDGGGSFGIGSRGCC